MFEVIPSIDLLEGRVVRLSQGDAERRTDYGDDPLAVGTRWVAGGARRLHVVDLDAAFGVGCATDGVVAQLSALGAAVQVGGGIHDLATARSRLAAGATDIVLGSLLAMPGKLRDVVECVGAHRVIGAIDVRQGRLQIAGWRRAASLDPLEAFRFARSLGVERFLVTAVERDGTECGPDLAFLRRFVGVGCTVWASGGIGRLEDLAAVAALGLSGAIVGRALYEGRFSLEQALQVAAC